MDCELTQEISQFRVGIFFRDTVVYWPWPLLERQPSTEETVGLVWSQNDRKSTTSSWGPICSKALWGNACCLHWPRLPFKARLQQANVTFFIPVGSQTHWRPREGEMEKKRWAGVKYWLAVWGTFEGVRNRSICCICAVLGCIPNGASQMALFTI